MRWLLPWLKATAFLHSVMMQEKVGNDEAVERGAGERYVFLRIFGTMLTRTGMVQSVHAFAQSGDSEKKIISRGSS